MDASLLEKSENRESLELMGNCVAKNGNEESLMKESAPQNQGNGAIPVRPTPGYPGTFPGGPSSNTGYAAEYVQAEEIRHRQVSTSGGVTHSTIANNVASKDIERLIVTYNLGSHSEENLTITETKDEIVSLIEKNSVVIIRGPTGCGKTTRVPQYILDNCFEKKIGCNIVVTQPRRIAATSIAKRVCDERSWPLPSIVGYQIGQDNCTAEDTRLTYCTTGVLLNQIIKRKNLNAFTHIIVDEVHERDQDTDFLLLIVRKLLRSNSHSVKIILMSATIDVNKFSKYFSFYENGNLSLAPVFDVVKMNSFRVTEYYLDDISITGESPKIRADRPSISQEMFVRCQRLIASLDPVEQLINSMQPTSNLPTVLVFLPGIWEIGEMEKKLNESDDDKLEITILHSTSSSEERKKVFAKPTPGKRQIILATNIAESSLTVPNVKYVIDFCLIKLLMTDPDTNFQYLQTTWASKANCQQRAGRTGRVMDGFVYRLVPRNFYELVLPEESSPEMLRVPLTNMILKAKIVDVDKPKALLALALDPPNLLNLMGSVLLLKESGALIDDIDNDICDGELTDIGRVMAELPIDIHISKMIALGYAFSVLADTIIMGACMAAKSMFNTPYSKKFAAYKAKLNCAEGSESDIITMRNVYLNWKSKKTQEKQKKNKFAEKDWARKNFVDMKVLKEVESVIAELESRLWRLGIRENINRNNVVWTNEEKLFVLKTVIAGAFYPHYFCTYPVNEIKSGESSPDFPSPTNTISLSGWPAAQPAMLYAKRIRDIFTECSKLQNEKISFSFDASCRIFIRFDMNQSSSRPSNSQKTNEIPISVYLALKLSVKDKKIKIPVLNQSKSKELATMRNVLLDTLDFICSFIEPPKEKDCPTSVELDGPYSPLRMKLKIMTNAGTDMNVLIDDFSVNSILLDPLVNNHQSRLLVATHVSTRRATKNRKAQLSVWNTTLFPSIPGLPSLMALIFSPQAELRCDLHKTRNAGVLCGLGYEPISKNSLRPERDMYIIFDTEITNIDLKQINNLRHSISRVISLALRGRKEDNETSIYIAEHQKNIQTEFKGIIERKRGRVSRDIDQRGKQWCRYNQSMFEDVVEESDNHVFQCHRILKLKERDTEREMMISHLLRIKKLAGGNEIIRDDEELDCKLCNKKISGLNELRSHLLSENHFASECAFLS